MLDTRDPVSPVTCSALSRRHETMEKLQEWMTEKVYGLNGTKDKTLKIRGNPKVFIEITSPTFDALPHHPPPHYYLTASPLSDLTRSSST